MKPLITDCKSRELQLKVNNIIECFPNLFTHINFDDILLLRIDDKESKVPVEIILPEKPYSYLLPYKYLLIIYPPFDFLHLDIQHLRIIHELLKIPKDYKETKLFRRPDIEMFSEEAQVIEWMKQRKFPLT